MGRRWGAALLLLGIWGASAAELRPGSGLKPDGVPALDAPEASDARVADPVSPRVLDWHPVQARLLVAAPRGGVSQLHELAHPGAPLRPLTLGLQGAEGRESVQTARYEPTAGRYIVFARDTGGDEAYRLYRWVEGQKPAPISPAQGRVAEWRFLADGTGLVYLREKLDREGGGRRPQSSLVWVDPEQPEHARELLSVSDGRLTQLHEVPSGQVLVSRSQGGRRQWLRVAVADGRVQALGAPRQGDDPGAGEEPTAELPAAALPVTAGPGVWLAQALRSDFRHPVWLDARRGGLKPHLSDGAADVEALAVPAPTPGLERPLALVYNVQGRSMLQFWRPGQAAQTPELGLPAGLIQTPLWHPRRPLLVFQHVHAGSPGRIWVWDHEAQRLQAWAGGDSPHEALNWQLLSWTGHDGEPLSGWHLAPPERFQGPRAVYVQLHGGPSAQSRPGYPSRTLRALVSELGLHVVLPNVRGSDGQGRRFLDLDNGRRREDAVRDVSSLLDAIARRPDMDAQQVVVGGGSYGGYMALAVAVAESDRIAGSICRVGIANFVSFLENTESYRRDNRRAEYGDERDPAMRTFLTRISPLTQAARVRKPLFVVHGRNDPRVPYSEAQAMVAAVRAQGTPVWFLTAEDEGHSFTKRDNRDYLHHATLAFVRQALKAATVESPPGK